MDLQWTGNERKCRYMHITHIGATRCGLYHTLCSRARERREMEDLRSIDDALISWKFSYVVFISLCCVRQRVKVRRSRPHFHSLCVKCELSCRRREELHRL